MAIRDEHKQRGSYVLLINLPEAQTITAGKLSDAHFPRRYYAYVGSARSGVKPRISHHLKPKEKPHWHIDYLLPKATITEIIIGETEESIECAIARALGAQFYAIPGFGSSDCHCPSHLFFATTKNEMKATVLATMKALSVPSKLMRLRGY